MNKGKFYVFEGIDGCGKTTQAVLLRNKLEEIGHKAVITKEPTDRPIGLLIRKIMSGETAVDSRATVHLFAADRIDHITAPETGILALLESGTDVISDRYVYSSYAYQSIDSGTDIVSEANRTAEQLLVPDAVIYIDIPPEAAMERIETARENIEIYENIQRLTKVRENYLNVFQRLKDQVNIFMYDGTTPPETIADEIWKALLEDRG